MRYSRYVKYNQIRNIFQVNNQKKGSSIICNFVNYMIDPFSRTFIPHIVHPSHKVFQAQISNDMNQDFNIIISNSFDFKYDSDYLNKMIVNFREKDVQTVWYDITTDPENKRVIDFAKHFNMTLDETMEAMVYKIKHYKPEKNRREDITIKMVSNDQILDDFLKILKDTFGPQSQDWAMYQRLIMLYKQHRTLAKMYVIYQNQQPASSGMIYFDKDIAIIDELSTRMKFAKQGLAHIMINYLIKQAKKANYRYVGLLATEAGLPLYLNIGFQKLHLYINEYSDRVHENEK